MQDLAVNIGIPGNEQYLEPCLRIVYAEDAPGFGYCVLIAFNIFDDDGLMRHIAETFPRAQLMYCRNKLGYSGTYNRLLQTSNARYVVILDDDTVVPDGTLPAMVAFMDAHPEVGVAGCKTLNPDGFFQWSFSVMVNLRTQLRNAFRFACFRPEQIYRNIDGRKTVSWLNGSFVLVLTETLASVGGLDDYNYSFLCEADWCLRIARAGWKVAFVPDVAIALIGGLHSVNSQAMSCDTLIHSHLNRYYFFHKHHGALQLALRPITTLGATLRRVKFSALHISSPTRRLQARYAIRAYATVIAPGFARYPRRLPTKLQRQNKLARAAS